MAKIEFCVFVLVHVLFVGAQWAYEDEGCRTPDRGTGNCIPLDSCDPLNDLLSLLANQSQPVTTKITNLLKQYHCGFKGKRPKVCCPSKPLQIQALITELRQKVPEPPDVASHRNIRLLPKDCGKLDTGDKIINGQKTGLYEFPWMALLSYRTSNGPDFKCGASIINNRYILTAAHCLKNLKNPLIGVRVGEHNIQTPVDCETTKEGERICSPGFKDLNIEEVIPHPEFHPKLFSNDIGLLRVTPMDLTQDNIRPLCLPLEKTRSYNFTGRNCLVTGWGVTETGRSSPELLKTQIPAVPFEECVNTYKNVATITHRQLCAGGKTKSDSCAGDSGGPLQVVAFLHGDARLIQQGIVSFGPKICGRENYPGVYTKVAYYMDWILDNMKP